MADNVISYGRALFYPYLNLTNEEWIKTAALYYKGLNRIVPEGYSTSGDVDIVKRLNENEEFIRNIDPKNETDRIANDFLNYAKNNLSNKKKRDELIKSLNVVIPNDSTFSIHVKKISESLKEELLKFKLAKRNNKTDQESWFEFEPVIGAMYMTCLANHLAKIDNLPVVTDDPRFQPLIRGIQMEDYVGSNDIGNALASIVIKSTVPKNIKEIPISKIIEIREKYNDERLLFYNKINDLVSDLKFIDSKSALNDCLESRNNEIQIAIKNLKRSYIGMGISTMTTFLGFSIPTFASGIGPVIAGFSLVGIALGKLSFDGIKYYNSRMDSPYSYILTLKRKFKPENFAKQLFNGKIIL